MKLSAAFVSLAATLSRNLPVGAVPLSHELSITRSTGTSVVFGPTFRYVYASDGTKLATYKNGVSDKPISDEELVNDTVVIKAIEASVSITMAVCTGNPNNGIACAAVGALSVLSNFFAAWYGRKREDDLDIVHNTDYPPIATCSTACRLKNEAPEGDWRLFGNVTVNGVYHDLHYRRVGNIQGIRAVQFGTITVKRRQEQDAQDYNDGGMMTDYFFIDENETAYDSFDSYSSQISSFADDAVDAMEQAGTIIECVNFEDSDGLLNGGLLAFGWNYSPYQFQAGQSEAMTQECY